LEEDSFFSFPEKNSGTKEMELAVNSEEFCKFFDN